MPFSDFVPLLTGGIGSLATVFSGLGANKTNLKIARETNEAQMDLAKYQYDRNIDLWNMQNAYNTPKSQMERYQAAGLNPNLIYGNGSSSAGNADRPSGYVAPALHRASVDNSYVPTAAQLFMNGLTQYANIKKTNAETAAVYQNISNLQSDNKLKQLSIIQQGFANAKTEEEAKVWSRMLEAQIANYDSSAVMHFASAQLADSNRFTVDALRPYVVANARENVNKVLEETKLIKSNLGLNGLRAKQLVAQISNLVANTQLAVANTSYIQTRTALNRILLDNGLSIGTDGLDRLLYSLGLEDDTAPWLKTAVKIGKGVSGLFK